MYSIPNEPREHDEEPREHDDRDLDALLQRSTAPVVVESYHAGWEKPWRGLTSQGWAELQGALGNRIESAVIETGANRALAVRYGLEVIPAVLVFVSGEIAARFSGTARAADVIGAVRTALRQERALESARRELEAASSGRATGSPVRSVLQRRPLKTAGHALAG